MGEYLRYLLNESLFHLPINMIVLGCAPASITLKQIRLPKSFGGFAIVSLELVRHVAYLASVVASWSHMDRFADLRIDFWLPHLDPPVRSVVNHNKT